jgi:hypothetical protein
MNWVFVDYENLGSLETLSLSAYERIFVFCGPKNTRIKVGRLPSDRFCHLEVIGVTTMGANNLDFHLAFHLGRFHETADKDVAFHIISNDSGFNGLVKHLKELGRSCKKVATKKSTSKEPSASKKVATTTSAPKKSSASKTVATKKPKPQKTPTPLSEGAALVVSRLKQLDEKKRPGNKESFLNWIESQCRGLKKKTTPRAVSKELVDVKMIRISGTDIKYEIGSN